MWQSARAQLTSPSAGVRKNGVNIVGEMADKGDAEAVAALVRLLSDSDDEVRRCAVSAINKVALCGDDATTRALAESARDKSPEVRAIAIVSAAARCVKGDKDILGVAKAALRDANAAVRKAACEALGKVALLGDKEMALALLSVCKDEAEDPHVRLEATLAGSLIMDMPEKKEYTGPDRPCLPGE
uniref:HEAT repeat domain-containing protein n=1 Tax=Alexandrium catenella TaxID=2925 RepID=A0A7S1W311_ALECA|mmetsp:Transcript_37317/g.100989  ORF Transcript_37317/g.100989 Transcript_37317/m.100989 type:complete len:186 (+) Transcript_37317:39-596(+)